MEKTTEVNYQDYVLILFCFTTNSCNYVFNRRSVCCAELLAMYKMTKTAGKLYYVTYIGKIICINRDIKIHIYICLWYKYDI